jgi:hypothetical protein
MLTRSPAIAGFFIVLGIPVCGLIYLAAFLYSTSHAHRSPTLMVLPFAAYFMSGCFSAMVRTMWIRKVAAAVGHLAPFGIFWTTRSQEVFGDLIIIFVICAISAVGWIRMLFIETGRVERVTAQAPPSES